jgi:hypothetical protein
MAITTNISGDEAWRIIFRDHTDKTKVRDVHEIWATSNGKGGALPWVGLFKLRDNRFMVTRAKCNRDGWHWDQNHEGKSEFFHSAHDAVLNLSVEEVERLELQRELAAAKKYVSYYITVAPPVGPHLRSMDLDLPDEIRIAPRISHRTLDTE